MFYLYFVLALSVIVALHEIGHFLAARFFGVRVEAFSIGFGPVLYEKNIWQTNFRISLIPLGGYVKMFGENINEASSEPCSFSSKLWWQKSIIAFSGPFANLLVAGLFFVMSFMFNVTYQDFLPIVGENGQGFRRGDVILEADGKKIASWSEIGESAKEFTVKRDGELLTVIIDDKFSVNPKVEPVIGEVAVGMPAYLAGMKEGDKILQIGNNDVLSWHDIGQAITSKERVKVVFSRDKQIFTREIEPIQDPVSGKYLLGITAPLFIFTKAPYGFFTSVGNGLLATASAVWLNYYGLYKLVVNPLGLADNLSGPIMISQSAKSFSNKGASSIFVFIAFINVVLCVMNLLPIPILDGGMILFAILEGALRRPVSEGIQLKLQYFGFFIIMSLMFFSFYNDADKLIDRVKNTDFTSEGV